MIMRDDSVSDFSSASEDEGDDATFIECCDCKVTFSSVQKGASVRMKLCQKCFRSHKAKAMTLLTDDVPPNRSDPPLTNEVDHCSIGSTTTTTEHQGGSEGADGIAEVSEEKNETSSEKLVRLMMLKDASLTVVLAGCSQTFVKRKFTMDMGKSSPLVMYSDLEVIDKVGKKLSEYYLLSAHFNSRDRLVVYSRAIVEDKIGAKYVVGAVLRTKCPDPRYDVLLQKVTSPGVWFRVQGLTKFRQSYTYLDEPFENHDAVVDDMVRFLHDQGYVWDGISPLKDEMGRPSTEGMDNIEYPQRSKRKSVKPVCYGDGDVSPPPKKRITPRGKRGTTNGNAKGKNGGVKGINKTKGAAGKSKNTANHAIDLTADKANSTLEALELRLRKQEQDHREEMAAMQQQLAVACASRDVAAKDVVDSKISTDMPHISPAPQNVSTMSNVEPTTPRNMPAMSNAPHIGMMPVSHGTTSSSESNAYTSSATASQLNNSRHDDSSYKEYFRMQVAQDQATRLERAHQDTLKLQLLQNFFMK